MTNNISIKGETKSKQHTNLISVYNNCNVDIETNITHST